MNKLTSTQHTTPPSPMSIQIPLIPLPTQYFQAPSSCIAEGSGPTEEYTSTEEYSSMDEELQADANFNNIVDKIEEFDYQDQINVEENINVVLKAIEENYIDSEKLKYVIEEFVCNYLINATAGADLKIMLSFIKNDHFKDIFESLALELIDAYVERINHYPQESKLICKVLTKFLDINAPYSNFVRFKACTAVVLLKQKINKTNSENQENVIQNIQELSIIINTICGSSNDITNPNSIELSKLKNLIQQFINNYIKNMSAGEDLDIILSFIENMRHFKNIFENIVLGFIEACGDRIKRNSGVSRLICDFLAKFLHFNALYSKVVKFRACIIIAQNLNFYNDPIAKNSFIQGVQQYIKELDLSVFPPNYLNYPIELLDHLADKVEKEFFCDTANQLITHYICYAKSPLAAETKLPALFWINSTHFDEPQKLLIDIKKLQILVNENNKEEFEKQLQGMKKLNDIVCSKLNSKNIPYSMQNVSMVLEIEARLYKYMIIDIENPKDLLGLIEKHRNILGEKIFSDIIYKLFATCNSNIKHDNQVFNLAATKYLLKRYSSVCNSGRK